MNAAMLLLVAGSFAPVDPAANFSPSVFQSSVVATFRATEPAESLPMFRLAAPVAPRGLTSAPTPRGAGEKRVRFLVEGGAGLHPGVYGVSGGGALCKPMKDKPEFSVQADVLVGFYRTGASQLAAVSFLAGPSTAEETHLFEV